MNIVTVVGNRPQFIKAAAVTPILAAAGIHETLVHTGQHYDPGMSQVFFDELGLPLPVRDPAADVVERERPDWVLVYGDTRSTLEGCDAAGDVPVAHVEAGLRSFDTSMPEERIRVEVDRRSALLFCPDSHAKEQLVSEGVDGAAHVVGDVMLDAFLRFAPPTPLLGEYHLLTIHRLANVQPERLASLIAAVNETGRPFVFPAHPRTASVIQAHRIPVAKNVKIVKPAGYLEMLGLLAGSRGVVTDSGGLQKEAYWMGKPCVTLRPNTEWVDTVRMGANILAEPDDLHLCLDAVFPANASPLYGDGHAAERIAALLQ